MGQPRRKWYLSRKLKESVKCECQNIQWDLIFTVCYSFYAMVKVALAGLS